MTTLKFKLLTTTTTNSCKHLVVGELFRFSRKVTHVCDLRYKFTRNNNNKLCMRAIQTLNMNTKIHTFCTWACWNKKKRKEKNFIIKHSEELLMDYHCQRYIYVPLYLSVCPFFGSSVKWSVCFCVCLLVFTCPYNVDYIASVTTYTYMYQSVGWLDGWLVIWHMKKKLF